jgi:gluconolactonase
MTTAIHLLILATVAQAQSGSKGPVVEQCPHLNNNSAIACVENYAAVLPYPFERSTASDGIDPDNDTFVDTSVPSDSSFARLQETTFVVFDQERGLDILGPDPKLERIFDSRNDSIHEAPVYVPGLNAIIFSQPHQGVYQQKIINLNGTEATISNYTTNPPVYAVNGGKFYKGKVYWAAEASFSFPSPTNGSIIDQTPGIYELDPCTGQVRTLLNNYYGQQLSSPNDLFVDSRGDIYFTDSWYGYAINVTDYPVLSPQTFRFRPSTGAVSVVENTLGQPNGIGISPDGKTMYISDTGITDFDGASFDVIPRYIFNKFGGRAVHAFDINFAPPGNYLTNRRPIWLAQTFAVDGLHVSREGYVLGASGSGLDVLSEWGELILRIEIGGAINNFQFVGEDRRELWLFGPSGIWKVSGLQGIRGMTNE